CRPRSPSGRAASRSWSGPRTSPRRRWPTRRPRSASGERSVTLPVALLEVERVSKGFGGVRAVHEVSFTLAEGELVGIMGPNGSGKTTLFNLIAGGLAPDSGRIRLRGRDIGGLAPHAICARGIARTFQLVRPFGGLTSLENVLVGRLYGRVAGSTRAASVAGGRRPPPPGRAAGPAAGPPGRRAAPRGAPDSHRPQAARARARACDVARAPAARRVHGRAQPGRDCRGYGAGAPAHHRRAHRADGRAHRVGAHGSFAPHPRAERG